MFDVDPKFSNVSNDHAELNIVNNILVFYLIGFIARLGDCFTKFTASKEGHVGSPILILFGL